MLNGQLTLHGVNIEPLATRTAKRWQRKHRITLEPCDHEDLTAYLIAEAWRLSEKFNPQRNDSFENYAASLLHLKATSWARERWGRTRWQWTTRPPSQREHQDTISLEQPAIDGRTDNYGSGSIHAPRYPRLLDTLTIPASSDPTDSNPALQRMETQRTSRRAQDLHVLDQRVPHRTAA